jgi:hypothetical protein
MVDNKRKCHELPWLEELHGAGRGIEAKTKGVKKVRFLSWAWGWPLSSSGQGKWFIPSTWILLKDSVCWKSSGIRFVAILSLLLPTCIASSLLKCIQNLNCNCKPHSNFKSSKQLPQKQKDGGGGPECSEPQMWAQNLSKFTNKTCSNNILSTNNYQPMQCNSKNSAITNNKQLRFSLLKVYLLLAYFLLLITHKKVSNKSKWCHKTTSSKYTKKTYEKHSFKNLYKISSLGRRRDTKCQTAISKKKKKSL